MASLTHQVQRAAASDEHAVVLGLHAIKHALRFGAVLDGIWCADADALGALAREVAPDVAEEIIDRALVVGPDAIAAASTPAPAGGVLAIAQRPQTDVAGILSASGPAPIVLLESPRRLGNVGACIRVGAAAGAAAVLTTGTVDPWHADVIRGAAGLHWAVAVARVGEVPQGTHRPLVAIDPEGEPLGSVAIPPGAVLAFGTERAGLSDDLLARADLRVAIPMRAGVSSLNLATAVAVTLYAQ